MIKLVLKFKSAKILKSKFWSKSEQYSSGHNSRKPHKLFFGLIIILYVIILVENCRNLPRTIKIGAKKRFCWLRIFNRWFIWWWKAIDSKIRPELQSTQSGYFAGYCSFFFSREQTRHLIIMLTIICSRFLFIVKLLARKCGYKSWPVIECIFARTPKKTFLWWLTAFWS